MFNDTAEGYEGEGVEQNDDDNASSSSYKNKGLLATTIIVLTFTFVWLARNSKNIFHGSDSNSINNNRNSNDKQFKQKGVSNILEKGFETDGRILYSDNYVFLQYGPGMDATCSPEKDLDAIDIQSTCIVKESEGINFSEQKSIRQVIDSNKNRNYQQTGCLKVYSNDEWNEIIQQKQNPTIPRTPKDVDCILGSTPKIKNHVLKTQECERISEKITRNKRGTLPKECQRLLSSGENSFFSSLSQGDQGHNQKIENNNCNVVVPSRQITLTNK